MKATHQQLIEKIMEYFKNQPGIGKYHDYITKTMIEHIYNEFLEELEEPTNSADAIFEQAASLETEITGTVDKIVDDTLSAHGRVWVPYTDQVAARGYEAVKKLITAVQDHAIQENREMIRGLQERYDKLEHALHQLKQGAEGNFLTICILGQWAVEGIKDQELVDKFAKIVKTNKEVLNVDDNG